MKISYRGNFQPDLPEGVTPWSTETHIAASLEALGHEVVRLQEDRTSWADTIEACRSADLFLWTSTYGMAHAWPQDEAHAAVETLNAMLPTAAVHLDLFFGLERVGQVQTEPWFKLGWVFTADGDHDKEFAEVGVNHRWFRPGVYHADVGLGATTERYEADIAFIGNWRANSYHREWRQRADLIRFLNLNYRGRVRFFPEPGQPAVRGTDLADLYASVKVVVGDSCFADRSARYCSDRPFESVGRGAFLLMPRIEWLTQELADGEHLRYWTPGDFGQLRSLIDHYLDPAQDAERERIRTAGVEQVRAASTYVHRMRDVLETLDREGAFRKVAA